jgi:RNA ligase
MSEVSSQYPSPFILDTQGNPTPKVDLELMQYFVGQKAVRVGQHPDGELTIHNYNSAYMKDNDYNVHPLVGMSRGLILDREGNVIARPFSQLTELGEDDELPEGERSHYQKIDGTMLVQYTDNEGALRAATRTSFDARHAMAGTELLRQYQDYPFDPNLTYIWEMVHPDLRNNLIVDYGNRKDITLLGNIATATGIEAPLPNQAEVPFPVVKEYAGPLFESVSSIRALDWQNREGVVVRMDSGPVAGQRFKIKFPTFEFLTMEKHGEIEYWLYDRLLRGKSFSKSIGKVPESVRPMIIDHVRKLDGKITAASVNIYAALRDEEDVTLTAQEQQIYSATKRLIQRMVAKELGIKPPRQASRRKTPNTPGDGQGR